MAEKHLVVDKARISAAILAMTDSVSSIQGITYVEIYEAAHAIEQSVFETFKPLTQKLISKANDEVALKKQLEIEEAVTREFQETAQERMKNVEKLGKTAQ